MEDDGAGKMTAGARFLALDRDAGGSAVHSAKACDVLVLGGGPAALSLASALAQQRLQVAVLAPHPLPSPWPNTYGIWGDEVDSLGLSHLLEHRWSHTVSFFGAGAPDLTDPANAPTRHGRDYGLFNREALQAHWLKACEHGGVQLLQGQAVQLELAPPHGGRGDDGSVLHTADGRLLRARLVVDATGHQSVFMRRPDEGPEAGQAAYGIVGRFSAPPVEAGQFVLMDYRCDHLSAAERAEPPTFLYAMDLGEGRFFVEETSLALAPAVPFEVLKQRLHQRLAHRGVAVEQVEHEEFCLFPMNLPLPDLQQPVLGFGGAASMVHPASGYMVGSLLRRAPVVAAAVAAEMADPSAPSAALARAGWQALWPEPERFRRAFYLFGLSKLMGFEEARLRHHFAAFFQLPASDWY
jgi:lycopene cyclase-like protein